MQKMEHKFCSAADCRLEAGACCEICRKVTCQYHFMGQIPAFNLENLSINEIETVSSGYSCMTVSGRAGKGSGTYKTFYTRVLPDIMQPRGVDASPRVCRSCAPPFVAKLRHFVTARLMPAIEKYRRAGELCTNDVGSHCFLDSDIRCPKCGRGRCRGHAAKCKKCEVVFCCDALINTSNDYADYDTVYGGCAAKHTHWALPFGSYFDEKEWKRL
jgi:hypothetical protein